MGLSGNTGNRSGKSTARSNHADSTGRAAKTEERWQFFLRQRRKKGDSSRRRSLRGTETRWREPLCAAASRVRGAALLAAAYLLGTFLAGVAAARCVAGDAETLSYYLNCWQSLFSVQDAAGAVRLFRTEFFTVAGALTAVLFLGLSALGPLPIFLFAMLYGTGSGLLSSRLLVDLNPRTAFVLLCVCGIPASLAAGTLCTFGASALQVSGKLCSAAFGRGGQAPSTGALLGQFARMLFLLLPLCGAAVGMLYLAGQAKLI